MLLNHRKEDKFCQFNDYFRAATVVIFHLAAQHVPAGWNNSWADVIKKSQLPQRLWKSGKCLFISQKYDSAIKNFSKAIAIGQSDKTGNLGAGGITSYLALAHDGLARAYCETGNYNAVIQEAELALQLKPDIITPW